MYMHKRVWEMKGQEQREEEKNPAEMTFQMCL